MSQTEEQTDFFDLLTGVCDPEFLDYLRRLRDVDQAEQSARPVTAATRTIVKAVLEVPLSGEAEASQKLPLRSPDSEQGCAGDELFVMRLQPMGQQ